MNETTLDFELRSPINLKTRGIFVYTECSDTEPTCLSGAYNEDRPVLWAPDKFLKIVNPDNINYEIVSEKIIIEMIMDSEKVVAQNSMVEYLAWNRIMHKRYGWPEIPLKKFHDTMAQLAYHALPMNLEQGASVLGLPVQKDMVGNRVMKRLCKPRKPSKAEYAEIMAEGHVEDLGENCFYHPESDCKMYFWYDGAIPLRYTKSEVKAGLGEPPKWNEFETLMNYCVSDVETTRSIHHTLPPIPPKEREIWLLDQKINLRGIKIDVPNVKAIIKVVKIQEAKQLKLFQAATKGAVSGPRSYVKLKEWINNQTGLDLPGVGKDVVDPLIEKGELPPHVMKALKIKAELSKSSVAKFSAMLNRMSADGRVRGWSAYHAATTGRWAAWGLQLHNNPRDSYKPEQYESVLKLFKNEDIEGIQLLWDDPYYVASRSVRGSLIAPPGKVFYCSDFSAVEGRGLAHLSGEDWVLQAYRDGRDMYKIAASDILGLTYDEITKTERNAPGKPSELGYGYGGGIGAYASMSKSYGLDLNQLPVDIIMARATSEELTGPYGAKALAARYVAQHPKIMSLEVAVACDIIKRKWRAARPKIVAFWKGLERAAKEAITNPGLIFSYREIKYCVHGGFLKCQLPSGRVMHYFDPKLGYMHYRGKKWVFHPANCTCKACEDEYSPSITYMGMRVVDGKSTRQWVRLKSYGGKLAENVTQGFTRDLLAWGMVRHEDAGYPIYMDVHDEDLTEVDQGKGSLEEFNRILEIKPAWAGTMPIKATGWTGTRYRK